MSVEIYRSSITSTNCVELCRAYSISVFTRPESANSPKFAGGNAVGCEGSRNAVRSSLHRRDVNGHRAANFIVVIIVRDGKGKY